MPRTMFFDGSMRSARATMRRPPTSARSASAAASGGRGGGLLLEHAGVGAERRDERRRWRLAGGGVAGEEAGLPLVAVEPAGAVAGHAVEQLGGDVVGEHGQHGRLGEGRVQEVHGAQVGAAFGQHPARRARSGSPARRRRHPRRPARPRRRPRPGCRPGSPPRQRASDGRSRGRSGRSKRWWCTYHNVVLATTS